MGWFKNMMRNWLEIGPSASVRNVILSDEDFGKEVLRNKIWYRGNPAELSQFYALSDGLVAQKSFWAECGADAAMRKMHSGLPALIVDVLADIGAGDLLAVKMGDKHAQTVWDAIAAENDFGRLLKRAARKALALGDGAFKISFDEDVSEYPIIEFFGADRVRFDYSRGRAREIVFCSEIEEGSDSYVLEEAYSVGKISYRLRDKGDKEVDLASVGKGREFLPIEHDLGINLAVSLIFDENPRFEGRGKSVFDGKLGAFDVLDEVLSQWVDALRDGRAQKYIPAGLLPRNPHNGEIMGLSPFQSRFIRTEMDLAEGADNSIKMLQANIDTAALSASCANYLNFALQGIIAPSTLGIDLKGRDNAEAQREKEKATLYTRGRIIGVLREVVGRLAEAAVAAYNGFHGKEGVDCKAKVEFGEYAMPDFGSQIEIIGRGRQMGVISVENAVEQLYGSSWSAEEKEAEAGRLKLETRG